MRAGQVFHLQLKRDSKRKTARSIRQESAGHRSTGQGVYPLCSHGYGVGIAHPAPRRCSITRGERCAMLTHTTRESVISPLHSVAFWC